MSARLFFAFTLALLTAATIIAHDIGWRDGYATAQAKAEADTKWVNEQMADMGFCARVKEASFAAECDQRSALQEQSR